MHARLALAVGAMACLLAAPARGDDRRDCAEHKDQDLRIAACSKLIQLAPTDAAAYNSRGDARRRKGDLDSAIADYSKVIELNPRSAKAYDLRGQAYASKGDYARAVLDVTKAGELAPKPAPAPKLAAAPKKPATKVAEQAPSKRVVRPSKPPAKAAPENIWPAWAVVIAD
jgi:tetratricopeptide (TPR) repeat protein